ncbi:demethylmenaquinone methyltransferase / 2-methoxy-6-polyprenyl-1,4-benzoquinol methylase [Marinitoga hydrogenitolerans DSM 16785]|uniref:Demethylmenaquinone methyltransferase / 2-methoxy-6-polyprenyl-1,4-benzoquinol methylase n=1 Tax=Marinitoga hydrogenitolerans (strain DSM 16785 / JCM 12826 / AT1271) TaxID=1122195 RepID=A0A1M4WKP5_MARH1|nr:class I SAM-dependent methyltransferase [Marinitoga hydrogenitolerans]SHE81881.1 demethylmenaquinone methyltransferase / 2-methoxy-6-polyprenyl-1,4-benzoquinol methylase [Marinitoga hydrogenitolerans DSM 16785]
MTRYDFIAKYYDKLLSSLEKTTMNEFRKIFVPQIEGYTLDLAVGTGNNISYYPKNSHVVLIDKSIKMLEIAKEKAKKRNDLKLEFINSSVENMPFKDNTFDTILSIDVFCSVKNPFKSMLAVKNVLKHGGKGIFVEHGLTGDILKDFFLYITTLITYPTVGSSMIRKPLDYIQSANFKLLEYGHLKNSFYYFIVRKE